jgi:DNA invertase Pin-like site-specific DNA recombinase
MESKHLTRGEIAKLLEIVSASRRKRQQHRPRPVLAAQYVRMSSEDQSYSISNQKHAIKEFARLHRLKIVRSYEDHGKSGLVLKGRSALQTLLSDVLSGEAPFSTVLVLDVTRWGRFIDQDEAACYEFLCRSAGVDVRYCAESFSSGLSFAGSISKSMKRLISTQFSRDLSKTVFEAKARLARQGYWMGGPPPFGMQRVLSDGKLEGRALKPGEWKATKDNHAVLQPGPSTEVRLLRTIFGMAQRGSTCSQIADTLNVKGTLFRGKRWSRKNVRTLLLSPVYTGTFIWGRTSEKLRGPITPVPRDRWVCSPHVLPSIVPRQIVQRVQTFLAESADGRRWCEARIKERLGHLLHNEGRLSESVICELKVCHTLEP